LIIQKHIFVYGKVQGVCYRHWLKSFANDFQVVGWVKNNASGEVEAMLIGQEEIVTNLIEQCYMGPPESSVTKIIINNTLEWNDLHDLKSFQIFIDN